MSILTPRKLNIMKVNAELRLARVKMAMARAVETDVNYVQPPEPQNTVLPSTEPPQPSQWVGGNNG